MLHPSTVWLHATLFATNSLPYDSTAPTLKGDLNFFQWGPNGDPIFCEMGTKWGPSTAEMGTQKAYISKLTETSKFIEEAIFFLTKNIHRDRVCPHLVHSVCAIYIE